MDLNISDERVGGRGGYVTSLPFEISDEIKAGMVLAGDDFSGEQLSVWFQQEQEAFYFDDGGNSDIDEWYAYMRYVNAKLGFSHVLAEAGSNGAALVLGPGSGIEVEDFSKKNPLWKLSFLESSDNFRSMLRDKWPESVIVAPRASGVISLEDDSQSLVCAFSVLHHIPNISRVIEEIFRVMSPGGLLLIREPCSSMGDWRYPRSATPNERGISRKLILAMAEKAGFMLERKPVPILLEPINKVLKKTVGYTFVPFSLLYMVDYCLSGLLSMNDFYWRDRWYKKIGPSSYFYIFKKPEAGV